jgi:Ni/Co efflux regulator RcnB
MKKTLTLAAAFLFAAIPLTAAAQAPAPSDQNSDPQRPPRSGSVTQDFKNDAKQAGREIKGDARETKKSVKRGAAKTKRGLAVAQCNDGRYSYTQHKTCNKHGGVRKRFR